MKLKKTIAAIGVVVSATFLLTSLFLLDVWWRDGNEPLPVPPPGTNDASRLSPAKPAEVIVAESDPNAAERQLVGIVNRARTQGLRISVSGARHSMGGHTTYPGGIAIDMDSFKAMSLDESRRILTVGAGARWFDIVPFLDKHGLSVGIMQTNNDFSVGGSISVNCHGWQNDAPPIASSVESFRLLKADGTIVICSRDRAENHELFSLALGGYGLFGIILEVNLRVVPNVYYIAEARRVKPADYATVYHELTEGLNDVGMAYGRINVAPDSFLDEGIVTILKRQKHGAELAKDTLTNEKPSLLKRIVFQGGIGSDFGKNLRWWLENIKGETEGKILSRNQIMNEPSSLYATRDPQGADILHEYFVPGAKIGEFVELARPILLRYRPQLLNITVRNVEEDHDTFLRYATSEVFGLVMLFHQGRDAASEEAMKSLTGELIDAAITCGGRYYLPYRPHASVEQFEKCYPQARQFFALKRRYDPYGVFSNSFFQKYGVPFDSEKRSRL